MHPVVSIAIDPQPAPQFRKHFAEWQKIEVPMGDSNTIMVMCSDEQMIAVRYTTTIEFLDLLREQRLMPLILDLRNRSPWSYLLLDGMMSPNNSGKTVNNGSATGFDWAATQGALLNVQEIGVQVVTLQATHYLQDTIYRLAERSRDVKRVRPAKEALFWSEAEDMLLSLPGIGDDRCATLLKVCGSAAWALDALCDPESKIPGIGPEIKKKVRRVLGITDTTRLAMIGLRPDLEAGYEELIRDTTHSHTTTAEPAHLAA